MNAKFKALVALTFLILFLFSSSALAGPGPRPIKCQPAGCYGIDSGDGFLDNTYVGETSVSPTVLKVGQKLTVNATAFYENGAASVVPLGKVIGSCEASTGSLSCQFKMTGANKSKAWQKVKFAISSPFGTGIEQDAIFVHGRNSNYISGRVTSLPVRGISDGIGVKSMSLTVRKLGRSRFSRTVQTDDEGYYIVKVKGPGKYRVTATRRDSDIDYGADFDENPKTVRVTRSRDGEANFKLNRGDDLEFEIRDTSGNPIQSVTSRGVEKAVLFFRGTGPNDEPLSDAEVILFVNQAGNNGTPKALVCGDGGSRIWPIKIGGLPDWNNPIADSFTLDASGEASLTLFFGTEPGTFDATANLQTEPTRIERKQVIVSTESPADMTQSAVAGMIFDAISAPSSLGGTFILNSEAPFSFRSQLSSNTNLASKEFMDFLSQIRGLTPGLEYVPVEGSNGSSKTIVAYPSGSVILQSDNSFTLPSGGFVFDPVQNGFSTIFSFADEVGAVSTPMVEPFVSYPQWLIDKGISSAGVFTAASGNGFLYGGAPYKVGDLASGGAMSSCAN